VIVITLAIVGLVVGGLGVVVAVAAYSRAARTVAECSALVRRQLQVSAGTADHRAIRDVALVHYDALKDVAGGLSFSLAMLNAAGDGIVLTSINGRTETRTYAKVIESGSSPYVLSPEEDQAVRAARLGQGPQLSFGDELDVDAPGPSSTP
jgi:hypothetical protein